MPKKKILRIYRKISDSVMLRDAETMSSLFETDQPQFLNEDASFDNAFKSDWDAKIDIARHTPDDNAINNDIEFAKTDLKKAWDVCKLHFQDAKYFIRKAFPDNAMQNKFGFGDYRAMSRNPNKVLLFMDLFYQTADENKVALIAKGYTQAKIDEIETLTQSFRNATRALQNVKKDRFENTHNRITKMNNVWKILQQVNSASKIVFKNNWAKIKQYEMPHS